MSDIEERIEKEVQRRVGVLTHTHHLEISNLQRIVKDCKNRLVEQNNVLKSLTAEPASFGNIVKINNVPDSSLFCKGDEMMVVDHSSEHFAKGGTVVSENPVVEDGCLWVKLNDGTEEKFSITQIRLTTKDDGTFAIVQIDGKFWEVALPKEAYNIGDNVKVSDKTKAIIGKGYDLNYGPICKVSSVIDHGVEVWNKGEKCLVHNPKGFPLEEEDNVVCDPTMFVIRHKLNKDDGQKYKIKSNIDVGWDDIGGLDSVKRELRDALELPFKQPDLYEHYKIEPLKGLLLFGPPGCGKTLAVRVCVKAMADIHGDEVKESGCIFIKGPEILEKWVGNTEAKIRDLFSRGRAHYRKYGYKSILAIDEADAILRQRGTGRSSDIFDTIVPMFLGEMDGVDPEQTKENPIVILLTNRPDILDPAVIRPERMSRHIKVDRPTEIEAIDILDIHSKGLPFSGNKETILAVTASDFYSRSRVMYRLNNEYDFTMADIINGALLKTSVEMAKMSALHRDLSTGNRTSLTLEDFRSSVLKIFDQQKGLNHVYDLEDFAQRKGLQLRDMKIDRCFTSK